MKISRQKKINKYLNFFKNNFGFHEPFQILIDGTYCFAALKNKHNIQEVLPKYFQTELKLLTTPCIIMETENLKVYGAMLIVKQFGIHKCNHTKPITGSDCIKSMIGKRNSNRYIVATQDRELQVHVRNTPGTPLIYLHQKTPVLEQPSETTTTFAKESINMRFDLSENEAKTLLALKQKEGLVEQSKLVKKKKKKGGPNPLSCKKKKTKPVLNKTKSESENKVGKKKKRKRIRIPEHIKQELLNR